MKNKAKEELIGDHLTCLLFKLDGFDQSGDRSYVLHQIVRYQLVDTGVCPYIPITDNNEGQLECNLTDRNSGREMS